MCAIMLATAISASLIAGCEPKNKDSTSDPSLQSASGNQEQTRSVVLNMLIPQPRLKEQYDAFIAKFVAKEKAEKQIDVTIQLETPGSDNAQQILKTRLASNDAPDVYAVHAVVELPAFYKAGYVEDLSDQPFAGKLLDSVKPSVTIDNKVLGVPLETLAWGYLYNKKMFSDLGITPPLTLSEMEKVAEKLKAHNITPFMLSYKESWIAQLYLPLTVGALVNTEHPEFIEKMNNDETSFNELKQMFGIIDLANANGSKKALEIGGDDGAVKFANGEAAMWIQGTWYAESILKAKPDFQLGVAALPVNDNPNATMIDLSTSTTLVVSPTSNNKDVAKDLINYVLDDQDSNEFYQSLKFDPVSTVHMFKNYPWTEDAMGYVKTGKAYQDPIIPQAVKDEIGKGLQSYYLGQLDQDGVIKAMDQMWQSSNKINN